MKRTAFSLAAVLLALVVLAPISARAISITFDNPNQSVAAPSSGVTTLTFSGTVTVDNFYNALSPFLDQPENFSHTGILSATLDSAFASFASTTFGGTYVGTLFTVSVPTGTLADLYGFSFFGGPSLLSLHEYSAGGSIGMASAAFSVDVTGGTNGNPGPGNGVPEGGSSLLLLGLGTGGLLFARRALA